MKKRPAAKKAYKKKAPARKPMGGKKPVLRRSSGGKTTVRQQNLGQQTDNKVALSHGRPDSRAPIMKAVSPACHYVNATAGTVTTSGITGRQAWGYTEIASVQDLTDIGTYLALNNIPGVNVTSARNPPASYLLTKCQHHLKFSNVGQATTRLTVIHCRAKRDIFVNMNYTDPTANQYPWGTIVDAVQQGIEAAAGGPVTGGVRYFIPGVDETESPIFNKYYTKVKTTEIFLAVGGSHTLTTNVSYDRVMDASVYGNSQLQSVMGASDYLLFKAEGQTSVIGTGEEPRVITIASTQLAYTQNWDYSFVQVQNARKYMSIDDGIGAAEVASNVISASTGSGVTDTGLIE
uniref:hypothetical protein n=1 Tax=Polynucleobacter sp. TaxID=2029855 RepID=UPI0040486B1C